MVTYDDIATAVVARCEASGDFAAAVPGKAWCERADENAPAGTYAVFGIERLGDPEVFSDGSYLQRFTLRVATYSDIRSADPQAAQRAVAGAINTDPTGWDSLRDGRVVHCLPRGYDGKFDPKLRAASDVFIGGAQWELLIEGNLEA